MWFGWSSRVRLPDRKTRRELVERQLPVGRRILAPRGRVDAARCVVVALGRAGRPAGSGPRVARRRARRARRASRTRGRTPAACCAPRRRSRQMKRLRAPRRRRPRAPGRRGVAGRAPRGLGREPPRLDRVVDALQRRHVHDADAVAAEQQPGRVEPPRQRDEAALRDRLRAPLDPLAALEDRPDRRVRLQLLEQVVHGERRRRGSRGRRPCRSLTMSSPIG